MRVRLSMLDCLPVILDKLCFSTIGETWWKLTTKTGEVALRVDLIRDGAEIEIVEFSSSISKLYINLKGKKIYVGYIKRTI